MRKACLIAQQFAQQLGCSESTIRKALQSYRRGDIRSCDCGARFLPLHPRQEHSYCSLPCSSGGPANWKPCPICGIIFSSGGGIRRSGDPPQETCSWECRDWARWMGRSTDLGWASCTTCRLTYLVRGAPGCAQCRLRRKLAKLLRGVVYRSLPRPCLACGEDFLPLRRSDEQYCKDPVCARVRRRDAKYRHANAVGIRSRIKATSANKTSLTSIGDRDGWRCHICLGRVRRPDADPQNNDRDAPSVDHVIPLDSLRDPTADVLSFIAYYGGLHVPENLRLAHKGCNSGRRVNGYGQLVLVA